MSTVRTGTRCIKSLSKQEKKKENNKMAKDIYEIRDDFKAGVYTFKLNEERLHKIPETHIFDEDLSVRRNREMVQEHNARVKDQIDRIRKGEMDMDNKLKEDCIAFLTSDVYDYITKKMAVEIYDTVYADKHHSMYEFFDYLEETADFVEKMLDMYLHPEKHP